MQTIIGAEIFIDGFNQDIWDWCDSNLVLDNPEYHKLKALGKWTGNVPQKIYLYRKNGKFIVLPFGCINNIWPLLKNSKYALDFGRFKPFDYRGNINLYPYQQNAVQAILSAKNGVIVMPCGSGKGLPIDAKICTPIGWKRNGDLQVGDVVVGSNGKSTKVTGVFDRGEVDAYKITFSDGVETVCDKDHLWTVQKQSQRAESGNWDVMSTQTIYEHYQNMKCRSQYLYIPIVRPVEFYGNNDCRVINPWLLGFLLGDGCFREKTITMSTSEDDLRKKVIDIICKDYSAGERLIHKQKYDWRFCGGHILHDIKSLGLERKHSYEKFVPVEYLFAPVSVRLAVLQGLFDADGHVSNGVIYEYSTASRQLVDDIVFIVESLGGTAKVTEKMPTYTYAGEKRTGRKAYRIFFKLYEFKPFTSEKHSAAYRERIHYSKAYRIIKKIEPCEPIISRCITVDAEDQLYVTEHFVVTHNTQCGLAAIAKIGGRALWLTHTQDLLIQSMSRAKSAFDCNPDSFGTITAGKVDIGQGLTFATVQTMRKIDLAQYRDSWDVIVVDECFPGDTVVATANGGKEIKNLLHGDLVASYNRDSGQIEFKPVVNTFRLVAHDLLKVTMCDGTTVDATSNHPFFVKGKGWIHAEEMEVGDYVMQLVRQGVRRNKKAKHDKGENKKTWIRLLLPGLHIQGSAGKTRVDRGTPGKVCGMHEKGECRISRTDYGANDKKKSNEKSGNKIEGVGTAEGDWTQAKSAWRKRNGNDGAAKDVSGRDDKKIGRPDNCCGISDSNKDGKKFWLSDLLQSRYRACGTDDCDRNRWTLSLFHRKAKSGCEESGIFNWVRVDSIKIQEQTSDGTFGGLCADGYVYNIEVADNNNYFANGILVHNCHRAVGSPSRVMQFYKVLSSLAARYKIGLTATPYRADHMEQSMFALLGNVIYSAGKDAVACNTCSIKINAIQTGYMPDYDAVLAGDGTINYSQLVDNLTHDVKRMDVVLRAINNAASPILVLGSRVEYLQSLAGKYGKRGKCISGSGNSKSAKDARKNALADLSSGKIDCLFSTYQLAAEGLDCPEMRTLVLATPEKDKAKVTQAVGRVGRRAEGKQYGTVIDFVDDFGMYKSWWKKRKGFYKAMGLQIYEETD